MARANRYTIRLRGNVPTGGMAAWRNAWARTLPKRGFAPFRDRMMSSSVSERFIRLLDWVEARAVAIDSEDAQTFIKIFRQYFHRFRVKLALIVIMIAVISGTTATVALMVEDVVNHLFVAEDGSLIIPLILVVLVIFFAKGVASYFQAVLSAQISNAIVADVQKRLFAHIVRQRMTFFSRYTSDELLMRFNQGAQGFGSILTTVLIEGVRDAATVASLVCVMFYQDALLALACMVVSPIVYFGVVILLRKIRGLAELEMKGFAELNRRVRESVQGITVIKAFNLEETAMRGADNVVDGLRARADRIASLQAAPVPLLDAVGGMAVAITILYAGLRIIGGSYEAGTFVSFVTALLLAADPARRLSQMRVRLRTSFIAVNLVYAVLRNNDPEPAGATKMLAHRRSATNGGVAHPPPIRFDNVGFSYAKDSPVLNGFDLDVEPGEMVALVGPSGAGKSTVFKLLLKFYPPSSGIIRVGDDDLAAIDPTALRDIIAYVGQSNFIFDGSIRDNLTLMDPDVDLDTIESACAKLGLDEYISGLPKGYDTNVGELGSMISGGQAQRLNLARAIIKDSPVLLLDEVTSALDAENEHRIRKIVREQARHKTILVIAHRLSTVKDADRIALVRDGSVIDVAPHEHLLKQNPYYEKIVALQFA